MRHTWKARCMFVCTCLIIIIYLALDGDVIQTDIKQKATPYRLVINEVMMNNRNSIRDEDGDFEDWIELYNYGYYAVSLKGFGLSTDSRQPFLWTFPDVTIEPKSYMIVWASEKNRGSADTPVHTNFKLKHKDKAIILTAPDKNLIDIFVLEPMGENISYGRMPDGSLNYYGFDEGTPGGANIGMVLAEGPAAKRLESPRFSKPGGAYKEKFYLEMDTSDSDAEIYYSLDGSDPTEKSERYTKPILISPKAHQAIVVRARAYKSGFPKSEIVTHSYFSYESIPQSPGIPVISLVTDPKNLFDYEKGIYVEGKVRDQWIRDNPNMEVGLLTPANYNQRGRIWEREGSIELIESDGTVRLAQNVGIRMSGAASASNVVKSFSIRASSDYDSREYLTYDFFDDNADAKSSDKKNNKYSRILLRSSGNDSDSSFFRDAFIQSIASEAMNLDTQRSRPCILYINGEYYGIRNIREDYDKYYFNQHYAIDVEDVVIVKNPTGMAGVEVQEGFAGDEMHYNHIISYINKHGIEDKHNYEHIKRYMDIDNFIEYNILQIYSDNYDWPGHNVSIWRKRTQSYTPDAAYGHDGRWRWLVLDMDQSFGFYKYNNQIINNSLERATEENGPKWPNPPWSTFLFRSLLKNEEFRIKFINTFADRLNSIFLPQEVSGKLEAMKEAYYPYVEMHIKRWNLHNNDVQNWLNEIEFMKKFAIERPKYIREHIVEHFGLSGTAIVRIETGKGGNVRINSLYIESTDTPWEGIYFKDIPIKIEAVPEPGFIFAGWEGDYTSKEKLIEINLLQNMYLKAAFKLAE